MSRSAALELLLALQLCQQLGLVSGVKIVPVNILQSSSYGEQQRFRCPKAAGAYRAISAYGSASLQFRAAVNAGGVQPLYGGFTEVAQFEEFIAHEHLARRGRGAAGRRVWPQ